jgi:hypothetical protein
MDAGPGDVLSVTLLARVGTDADGGRCKGRGASHANATGLRVYFDSATRASGLGIGMDGEAAEVLYLHADGSACASRPGVPAGTLSLDASVPGAVPAKCADSAGVNFKGGNPWREVGTWTTSLPADGVGGAGAREGLAAKAGY